MESVRISVHNQISVIRNYVVQEFYNAVSRSQRGQQAAAFKYDCISDDELIGGLESIRNVRCVSMELVSAVK